MMVVTGLFLAVAIACTESGAIGSVDASPGATSEAVVFEDASEFGSVEADAPGNGVPSPTVAIAEPTVGASDGREDAGGGDEPASAPSSAGEAPPTSTARPAATPTPTTELLRPTPTATHTPTPEPTLGPIIDPPSFGLAGGSFVGTQVLTIETERDTVVLYTLDGTTPVRGTALVYDGPVTIEDDATVTAVAIAHNRPDSEERVESYRIFSTRQVVTDPLVLSDDEEMEIVDTWFVMENDVRLSGDARLVITDSLFEHVEEFAFQYGLSALDRSAVVFTDSELRTACTGSLNWSFFDETALIARDIDMTTCNTWNFFTDAATAVIESCDYYGSTVCARASADISASADMEIELCYGPGAVVDEELPTVIDEFSFPNENDSGIDFSLRISDSTIDGWGVGVVPNGNITIRNSPSVTISMTVGFPWTGQTVVLDELANTTYEDKTWQIVDTTLRFVNVTTYGWEPNVFGTGNTLIIRNSDYSGSSVNSGNGTYIIEDSLTGLMRTHESVHMEIYRSVVDADVIATDESHITLVDSEVTGNVIAERNGKVTLVNTTVGGRIDVRDDGQVSQE